MYWLSLIAIAGFAVGIMLLLIGRRFGRTGDHPYCARCRYDLFGQPAGSMICPECGSDITPRRAKTIGLPRPSWWMIGGGCLLMFAAYWPLRIQLAGESIDFQIDWYKYKTGNSLIRAATASQPDIRAQAELSRRITLGTLDDEQINRLMDTLIGQKPSYRDPYSLQLIVDARRAGRLDEQRWAQFLFQSSPSLLKARTTINFDQPFLVALGVENTPIPTNCTTTFHSIRIDGKPLPSKHPLWGKTICLQHMPTNVLWLNPIDLGSGKDYGAGSHLLEIDTSTSYPGAKTAQPPPHAVTLKHAFFVNALGKDRPLTIVVPTERAAMHQAFTISAGAVRGELLLSIEVDNNPRKVTLRSYVRAGEAEYPCMLWPLVLPAGSTIQHYCHMKIPNIAAGQKIDVILRSLDSDILKEVDDTQVWGEDLIYKDVPIQAQPPAISPANLPGPPFPLAP